MNKSKLKPVHLNPINPDKLNKFIINHSMSKLESIGNFDISFFLSRYLAGKDSLKSARNISRKRISLAQFLDSFKFPPKDVDAWGLQLQMQRYKNAKEYRSGPH